MKILIVSATLFEVKMLVERVNPVEVIPNHLYRFTMGQMQADLLTPGIGMLHTAFYMGKLLHEGSYDIAINAGICGAYNHEISLGRVLHIVEEQLPEPGVEENGTLRSLFELGLMPGDKFPFIDGKLVNILIPEIKTIERLKKATGNTVNTMQTDQGMIKKLIARCKADTESMEGAAFLFACLHENIHSAQIRAVSNYVGERDKAKWEIKLALKELDKKLMEILEEIQVSGFKFQVSGLPDLLT